MRRSSTREDSDRQDSSVPAYASASGCSDGNDDDAYGRASGAACEDDACCRLGAELRDRETLYRSRDFSVVPTLGAMGIVGYTLCCSNEHITSMAQSPHLEELEGVLRHSRRTIARRLGMQVLVFEHGIGDGMRGGCIDHAHVHLVPTTADVTGFLSSRFALLDVEGIAGLRDRRHRGFQYLYVSDQQERSYLIETPVVPSQYIRQIIAAQSGIPQWDWRGNPDLETFKSTYEALRGRF